MAEEDLSAFYSLPSVFHHRTPVFRIRRGGNTPRLYPTTSCSQFGQYRANHFQFAPGISRHRTGGMAAQTHECGTAGLGPSAQGIGRCINRTTRAHRVGRSERYLGSEEHTSELQSQSNLVYPLLL